MFQEQNLTNFINSKNQNWMRATDIEYNRILKIIIEYGPKSGPYKQKSLNLNLKFLKNS